MDKRKLKEVVEKYNAVETTQTIRTLKHSSFIKEDVRKFLVLKRKYSRLSYKQLEKIAQKQCEFLFKYYRNIFNRLMKGQLDLNILDKLIQVLKRIEDTELDQHEGSAIVGQLLKELYIDPIINTKKKSKNITWNKWKLKQN